MILEMAGRAAQVLVALAGAYLVVLWFVLIVWTFRDIETRSRSVFTQVFSTLLSVLFFVPGVLLYLLLRPKETLDEAFQHSLEEEYLLQDLEELPHCQSCHRYVEDDFVLCPHCHAQLREACGNCERLVDLRWPLCPYCGVVQSEHNELADRAEPPAARWTAPGLRRRRVTEGAPRPRALPSTIDDERRDVAVAMTRLEPGLTAERVDDDTSSLAASLASGVRSMVRPFDKLLGRGGSGSDDAANEATAASPHSSIGHDDDRESRDAYGQGTNGVTGHGAQLTRAESVVVARNRFAINGQPGASEPRSRPRDEYRNGSASNGAGSDREPIVPFPSEAERTERDAKPAGITWPPTDRDQQS